MNDEWILLQIIPWILALVIPFIAYRLGLRSQKFQVLREYIIGTVEDEYPLLFSEIRQNSEYLDKFLEYPNYQFPFSKLYDFFNEGRGEFMKKHHNDLFLRIDFFQKEILPKINELVLLTRKTRERIFDYWSKYLTISLPKAMADKSRHITRALIKDKGTYYIFPALLNKRYDGIRDKIETCILDRTSQMYIDKQKSPYILRKQSESVNLDEISQSLLEKATPEIAKVRDAYEKLKEVNDKEVKEKLLPLIQKYISNPI